MNPIPRVKLREVLFLFVYAMDFAPQENLYALSEIVMDELKVARSAVRSILSHAEMVMQEKKNIQQLISDVLIGYSLDRLKSVERTILTVMVFEMCIGIDGLIPPKVSITEGKRLAKKFAAPEAASLIHAVLASIAKKKNLELDEIELKENVSISSLIATLEDTEEQSLEALNEGQILKNENNKVELI